MSESDVEIVVAAAGGLLWRVEQGRVELAVVHRRRYDDWSWPKGKLDKGESVLDAAVREVREETGYEVEVGPMAGRTTYPVTAKGGVPATKIVDYSIMRVVDGTFTRNKEVDDLRWVGLDEAPALLTYGYDRALLEESLPALRGATNGIAGSPQLTHLALGVADLERSVAFYERHAGLRLVHQRQEDDGKVKVAWIGDPANPEGFVLVLAEGLARNEPLGPFAHLGFAVGSRKEVDTVAAQGVAEGCLRLAATDAGPIVGYICELTDPDGNVCEFSYGQSLGRHGFS